MKANSRHLGDCLELMQNIEDKSIGMILCDLPYGVTNCKWDEVIPFTDLWEQYKRIIKDNCAIVLTASQPFTSALVMSNPSLFKYEWIWEKSNGSNFLNANRQPLKAHENVLVFGEGQVRYNPIKAKGKPYNKFSGDKSRSDCYGEFEVGFGTVNSGERHPKSVLYFPKEAREVGLHPTQKPVRLFEYLIKTYTNEGDIVLDNCAGSGTTAIACINTKRNYICIEKDEKYFSVMNNRIKELEEKNEGMLKI